jgi:DNA-binding winged helix-turn-helix (wHTH) protein
VDLRFGPFTLDQRARQLRRGAQVIHLSPKAFNLLALLLERRPDAISKAELHEKVWHETFVSDVNLAVLIGEIRSALGEDARHPRFVRTLHRFGYAFSGTVSEVARSPVSEAASTAYCLAWGTQRAPLVAGENLLGRDPEAHVRIDAVGVSRRHALIIVAADEVTLEDLSSKNGTFVDDVRVSSPVLLTDGAEIRLGPAPVCFRRLTESTSTQTVNSSRSTESQQ